MGYMLVVWYIYGNMGEPPYLVCGVVCVDGMVREKHSIWFGTFAVWYPGTMSWIFFTAKFTWGYGMF